MTGNDRPATGGTDTPLFRGGVPSVWRRELRCLMVRETRPPGEAPDAARRTRGTHVATVPRGALGTRGWPSGSGQWAGGALHPMVLRRRLQAGTGQVATCPAPNTTDTKQPCRTRYRKCSRPAFSQEAQMSKTRTSPSATRQTPGGQ